MLRRGSKGLIREINESLVLAEIRTQPISRSDIARRTGLSLPTVSAITAALLSAGLIEERRTGASGGGRPPVQLVLRPDAGFVIGIKLTETAVIAVLTDLAAAVVARQTVPTHSSSVTSAVTAITAAVRVLTPAAGGAPIYGVSVGLAGVVNRASGVVRHATYGNWERTDVAAMLEEALGVPVAIDNDVNALVASEQWYGAGQGITDFAVVSIGRGIGLGMVLDGRLYRGAGGGAGEFGHVKVADDGPQCACGGSGCLETFASDPAICAQLSSALGRAVDIHEAIAMAYAGQPDARTAFAHAGTLLGAAVGNVVNVLNPQRIILAGEGTRAADLILPALHEALNRATFATLRGDVEIVVEAWDDQAWAQGAASLLLGELFAPNLQLAETGRPSLTARTA